MKMFSLTEMTQFANVLIFANAISGSILGQHNKKLYSKIDNDSIPIIASSQGIHTNQTQEIQKVFERNGTFQNSELQAPKLYISESNEIIEISQTHENSNHSKSTQSSPRWEFFDDFQDDLQMDVSQLALLLTLMLFCFIISLTCILRCCCFFCNRKAYNYPTVAVEPAIMIDAEDQSFMNMSSDSSEDFYYERFFKSEDNANDKTVLIPPVA